MQDPKVMHASRAPGIEEVVEHQAVEIIADIPHIRLRVSKEPTILHDGDGSGIFASPSRGRTAADTATPTKMAIGATSPKGM